MGERRPDSGDVRGNIYRNEFFGFTYSIPRGWTVLKQQSQSRIRLSSGPLYTLLFATSSPTAGSMSATNSGIVILAEDVSATATRNSKDAADSLWQQLARVDPPHASLATPHPESIGGKQFYRLDYRQQTFPTVEHYFCSVVGVVDAYVIRFSVISDTKAHMEEICGSISSMKFEKVR